MNDELRELYHRQGDIEEHMDRLQGDTWGWNRWFDLMCRLLQHDDSRPAGDTWPDTITWDTNELRELISEMEGAWLDQVRKVYNPYWETLGLLIKEEEE
jgi:hypothetical protein